MRSSLTYIHLGRAHAAILHPMGALDRSNYDELVGQAWAARDAGAQHLLVDLSGADRVSIAGLVGLHAVVQITQGVQPLDAEAGWQAIRALAGPPGDGGESIHELSHYLCRSGRGTGRYR